MTRATRALQPAGTGRLELKTIVAGLSVDFAVATGANRLVRRARLDTFDGRLHAAGLSLEHQTVASRERLVLSRSDGTSTVAVPVADLGWPARADDLPGPVRDVIASVTGVRALMVTSDERRRVRRLELHNEGGKTVARIELDQPSSAGGGPARLTVTALRGYGEQARRATRLLVALGLHGVEDDGGHEPSLAPLTDGAKRGMPSSLFLAIALKRFLATMHENLPGLLADTDTEFLHDFRVAVRRTRATLKLGRHSLPEAMHSRWEFEFRWLGDLTTPLRDLDVYELELPMMGGWLMASDPTDLEPLAKHLRSRRAAARRTLVRRLRSVRFRRLLAEWGQELDQLADMPDADREHVSSGRLADLSISRAYRRVTRDGAAISGDSPAENLHALRKRSKELRYALEVFTPVLSEDPRRVVADLKTLQDVLGRFQDSEVQRQALRVFAKELTADGTPTTGVLAIGELISHLDAEQDRARREVDGAFARLARPSSRRLMHRLEDRR